MSVTGDAATERSRSSAHLGATLRSVLVAPTAGFEAARRNTQRRARRGESPAEGYAPYVLATAGGVSLVILWLKVSALLGTRDASADDFRWAFLGGAALLGAAIALAAQWLFGAGMARALKADARDLRLVWGAAAFPQMFALAVLLPSDVLVVGPEAFTTARLTDPVSSAWASLSIAVGVALALWSWGLLAKGVEVAAGVRFRTGLLATLGGGLCLVICIALLRFGAVALLEMLA